MNLKNKMEGFGQVINTILELQQRQVELLEEIRTELKTWNAKQ